MGIRIIASIILRVYSSIATCGDDGKKIRVGYIEGYIFSIYINKKLGGYILYHTYELIETNLKNNLTKTLSDFYQRSVGNIHKQVADFEVWVEFLKGRYEYPIYLSALEELNRAVFSLLSGQYHYAYFSLRYSLEQSLFAIYLSVHEIDYRMWKKSLRDVFWSEIVDENGGIFSYMFVKTFAEEFIEEVGAFRGIATALYRELSEYVHGNPSAVCRLPSEYSFDEKCFDDICIKFETFSYIINIIFFIRFKDTLIENNGLEKLENVIFDNIGTHSQVQAFYNQIILEGEEN